ncbi:uncharacterized protein LOC142340934 [Convolutriloba macropyga]|uniref:uncharacterized protein LOC142340934 n=1 Tax=Convolutriloba macropyga TaxID=536237 RepID=UPI003F522C35
MSLRRDSTSTDPAGLGSKSKHQGIGSALPPVKLSDEHPLQWRCVSDVNIEKRLISSFDTWKFDVQCQIANMGRKIDKLTRENDLDDLDGYALRSPEQEAEHQRILEKVAAEYREHGVHIGGSQYAVTDKN